MKKKEYDQSNNSIEQSLYSEADRSFGESRNSLHIMDPDGSVPSLPKPAICP